VYVSVDSIGDIFANSIQEANEGRVAFDDEEPEVVDQVLVFLYTQTYQDLAVLPDLPATQPEKAVDPPQIVPQERPAENNGVEQQGEKAIADWICGSAEQSEDTPYDQKSRS
jgi:hypothetical protein